MTIRNKLINFILSTKSLSTFLFIGMTILGFFATLLEFKVKENTESDDENAEILKFANTLRKKGGLKKFK